MNDKLEKKLQALFGSQHLATWEQAGSSVKGLSYNKVSAVGIGVLWPHKCGMVKVQFHQ
jgi:hypothetical protein